MAEFQNPEQRSQEANQHAQKHDSIAWLHNLLSSQIPHETVSSQLKELVATQTVFETIEEIQSLLSEAESTAKKKQKQHVKKVEDNKQLLATWETSGGSELTSRLDDEAVNEINHLADTCSALNMGMEQASSQTHRILAITDLAQKYNRTSARLAERKCALAEAQAALRGASKQLLEAISKERDVSQDIDNRTKQASEDQRRAELMKLKADEYREVTTEYDDMVEKSGLTEEYTHEAVARQGQELKILEQRLVKTQDELNKFEGLPPDIKEAEQKLNELDLQIAELDASIQLVINSMVR